MTQPFDERDPERRPDDEEPIEPERPGNGDAEADETPADSPGLIVLAPGNLRRGIRLATSFASRIGSREELEVVFDDLDLPPLAATLEFDGEGDLVLTPHVDIELDDIPIEQPTVVPLGAEIRIGDVVLQYRRISEQPEIIEAEIPSDRVTPRQALLGTLAVAVCGVVLALFFLSVDLAGGPAEPAAAFALQPLSGLSTDAAITVSPRLLRPPPEAAVVVVAGDGELWAYRPMTGERLWSARVGPNPRNLSVEGDRVSVSFGDGLPCLVDAASGEILDGARTSAPTKRSTTPAIEILGGKHTQAAPAAVPEIDAAAVFTVSADLDLDGAPDAITLHGDGRVRARSAVSGATLIDHDCAIPVQATPLVVDLNGDQRPDLCIASTNGGVYTFQSVASLF